MGSEELLGNIEGQFAAGISGVLAGVAGADRTAKAPPSPRATARLCPQPERREAWPRLGKDLDPTILSGLCQTLTLAECIPAASRLLAGQVRGRVIVPLDGAE
jgi:hypothetical protein